MASNRTPTVALTVAPFKGALEAAGVSVLVLFLTNFSTREAKIVRTWVGPTGA